MKVKAIFEAEEFVRAVDKLVVVRDSHVDPVVLVSPGSHVGEDLRFASAFFSPEEHARVVALKARERCGADFLRAPMMVTELVVSLKVELVIDDFPGLKISQLVQVAFLKLQGHHGDDFTDLSECAHFSVS